MNNNIISYNEKIQFSQDFTITKQSVWNPQTNMTEMVQMVNTSMNISSMPLVQRINSEAVYGSSYQKIDVKALAIDNFPTPGSYLKINEYGKPMWSNPFEEDEMLRHSNPNLQVAFDQLLQSLQNYVMVKKLITDDANANK